MYHIRVMINYNVVVFFAQSSHTECIVNLVSQKYGVVCRSNDVLLLFELILISCFHRSLQMEVLQVIVQNSMVIRIVEFSLLCSESGITSHIPELVSCQVPTSHHNLR